MTQDTFFALHIHLVSFFEVDAPHSDVTSPLRVFVPSERIPGQNPKVPSQLLDQIMPFKILPV